MTESRGPIGGLAPNDVPTADIAALVRCDGVSRTFGTGTQAVVAVHEANCVIHHEDRIAITGASGSGKSTLLHLIAGLDRPSAGWIRWVAGSDPVDGLSDAVAVVFQGPSLMPPLSVLENVAMPLLLSGCSDQDARRAAASALADLDIAQLADRLPEELSGGQAQRVCVARVLVSTPRLILADEPTGRLDSAAAAHVADVLIAAADRVGAALVVCTHDPLVASRFATRWNMRDGVLFTSTVPSPVRPLDRSAT